MTATEPLDLALIPPPGGQVLHQSDRCTVVWGDCRDPAVIAACPRYELLLTDPPYGIAYQSGWAGRPMLAGDNGTADWPAVLGQWVGQSRNERLRESRHVYVFGYDEDVLAAPLFLSVTADLIWAKERLGQGNLAFPWARAHEPITMGVYRADAHGRAAQRGALAARLRRGSVLRYPRVNGAGRHPTEKPIPLCADLVESSTVRGDLVVDPCAGSGSTAVAAVLLGRRAWICEIDRHHAETTATRVRAAEKVADQIAVA